MAAATDKLFTAETMLGDATWVVNSSTAGALPNKAIAGDALVVTAAVAIVAVGQTLSDVAQGKFSSDKMKETWKPVVQSAGSVPIWDLAQKAGYAATTGAVKGLAASSILVGVCASPVAFLIGYLYDLATDETTRAMWRQRPDLMGKKFLKDLLLSATVGAIPNVIWSLVSVLALFALLSAGCPPLAAILLTAALVAGIVAFSNVQFGEKLNKTVDDYVNQKIKEIWNEDLNKEYDELKAAQRDIQMVPLSAE